MKTEGDGKQEGGGGRRRGKRGRVDQEMRAGGSINYTAISWVVMYMAVT